MSESKGRAEDESSPEKGTQQETNLLPTHALATKMPINPFRMTKQCERDRNFPSFDGVFEASSSANESVVSAVLNISVQGAWQEHNHQVALYGIERVASIDSSAEISGHSLDKKWEMINREVLNGSTTSTSSRSGSQVGSNLQQQYMRSIFPVAIGTSHEAIEVMTDTSLSYSSFFQESSIELLKTPESCRLQRTPTKRASRQQPESEASTSFSSESEMRMMARIAGLGSPLSKFDISGESETLEHTFTLDRVNLSRISAAESDAIRTPNINNSLLLNQSAISTCSSDHNFQLDKKLQHKFVSSPFDTSSFRRSPTRLPPRGWPTQMHSFERFHDLSLQEEVESEEHVSSPTLASNSQDWRSRFATSPLPAVAPGGNSFVQNNVEMSYLEATNDAAKTTETVSSITSNTTLDKESSGLSSIGHHSSSPTSVIPENIFSVGDRRRYRTVVPKRVFLHEPSQFPIEDDSFSCHRDEDARSVVGNISAPLVNERSVRTV